MTLVVGERHLHKEPAMFELFSRLLQTLMVRTALSIDADGNYVVHPGFTCPVSCTGLAWPAGEFDVHDYAWFVTCNGLLS
jgi:hypothetical protein